MDMGRIEILDGLRGYFLVFMIVNHLKLAGGVWLAHLNIGELGYVQDAQGFVFLSGLLVGLIHSRRMLAKGFERASRKMWRRALEIYCYALACLFGIALLSALIPGAAETWSSWLWGLGYHDPGYLASAALLLYQPNYMDILPQYILYMLAAPLLLWLCLNGRAGAVIAGSVVLWLIVQLGLDMPLGDAAHAVAGRLQSPDIVRVYFNPLAWQICFVSGLVLGSLTVIRQLDWSRLITPQRTLWTWSALAVLGMFAVARLGMTFQLHPAALAARITGLDQKEEFGLIYLINFIAAAYLTAWTLIAGRSVHNRIVRGISDGLDWLLRLPFLRLLGRHSLQVYSLHVFLIYGIHLIDARTPVWTQGVKTIVLAAAIVSLGLLALYREARFYQARRQPAVADS
jgi:hypothetical protein